jgi:hypothetical protein
MNNGRQPSSRTVVEAASHERLKQLRIAGVEFVRILGSGMSDADCELSVMMKNEVFPIDTVPGLPLITCDREDCKCTWVPAEPPAEPKVYYYMQGTTEVGPVTLNGLLEKLGRDEIPRDLLCAAPGDAEWRPLCKIVEDQEQAKLEREIEKLRGDLEAKTQELTQLRERHDQQ